MQCLIFLQLTHLFTHFGLLQDLCFVHDNLFMQSLHIVTSGGFENFLKTLCLFISLDMLVGSNPNNAPICFAVNPCSNAFAIVCLLDKSKCLPLLLLI